MFWRKAEKPTRTYAVASEIETEKSRLSLRRASIDDDWTIVDSTPKSTRPHRRSSRTRSFTMPPPDEDEGKTDEETAETTEGARYPLRNARVLKALEASGEAFPYPDHGADLSPQAINPSPPQLRYTTTTPPPETPQEANTSPHTQTKAFLPRTKAQLDLLAHQHTQDPEARKRERARLEWIEMQHILAAERANQRVELAAAEWAYRDR